MRMHHAAQLVVQNVSVQHTMVIVQADLNDVTAQYHDAVVSYSPFSPMKDAHFPSP